jgi:hypothetical protein
MTPNQEPVERWEKSTGLEWKNDCNVFSDDPEEHYPNCQGCERIAVINKEEYEKLVALSRAEVLEEVREKIEGMIKKPIIIPIGHEYCHACQSIKDGYSIALSDTLAVVEEMEQKK